MHLYIYSFFFIVVPYSPLTIKSDLKNTLILLLKKTKLKVCGIYALSL